MIPPKTRRSLFNAPSRHDGFSLVEVVLAVGVVAFAFVAILGLIPAGLNQFRQAVDISVCAQISQRVILEAQQTDFDLLIDKAGKPLTYPTDNLTFRSPGVGKEEFRYFDEQGKEVIPKTPAAAKNPASLSAAEKAAVIYHVLTRVSPSMSVPRTGNSAKASVPGGDVNLKSMATITVQVAYNPSNKTIPINSSSPSNAGDPGRNLFIATTPGVTIKTYSAQVGQNQ